MSAEREGLGRDLWNISVSQARTLTTRQNVAQILYFPSIFFSKLCVVLQMYRIFHTVGRDMVFWLIQILIWSNLVFYFAATILFIVACISGGEIANPSFRTTSSSKQDAPVAIAATINMISDIFILLLPIFAVWKLQIALRKKFVICTIFGSGLL